MYSGRVEVLIRSKNLNLIPVLQALLQEVSVAAAAKRVHLSQPAVSGVLAQLRLEFDDPLLVRVGRSMRLTPRALQLRPQVDQLCAEIERLFEPFIFDPGTADTHFVIAAPDHLGLLLSKVLLRRLHVEAPRIRIRFVAVPTDLAERLHDRSIDLAFCANFNMWPTARYQSLLEERIVVVVSKDHPLAKRRSVHSSDLVKYPGVNIFTSVASSPEDARPITGLPSLDWAPQILMGQFTDAVLLAVESPNVARAPASLAGFLSAMLPLAVLKLTGEEDRVDAGIFWAPVHDASPEHVWLRTVVQESVRTFDSL
jgi:LysR family transcriptional regulator, nod-box dependent transcriptional activator